MLGDGIASFLQNTVVPTVARKVKPGIQKASNKYGKAQHLSRALAGGIGDDYGLRAAEGGDELIFQNGDIVVADDFVHNGFLCIHVAEIVAGTPGSTGPRGWVGLRMPCLRVRRDSAKSGLAARTTRANHQVTKSTKDAPSYPWFSLYSSVLGALVVKS